MDRFTVFLPINKGLAGKAPKKIIEILKNGNEEKTRTKYKFSGIASTNTKDRDNEIMSKECLLNMAEQINKKKLPIFGNHDHTWENMLGYSDNARVEGDQVIIDITTSFSEVNPKIDLLVGGMEADLPYALSIGGTVKSAKPGRIGKERILEEVDLYETSIVGIGANPDAYLSLPDQLRKSLKGEIEMNDTEKSAGQSGMASYGKLGETTPEARCPVCGKPAEFRKIEGKMAVYFCNSDGTEFMVSLPTKANETASLSQPLKPGAGTITDPIPALGMKSEEPEITKESKGEIKMVEKAEKPDTEDEYKRFKCNMERYQKEAAEGITTVPGGENANPKNSIGAAKSAEHFEVMKKAVKEEVGAESLIKEEKAEEAGVPSFSKMRAEAFGKSR